MDRIGIEFFAGPGPYTELDRPTCELIRSLELDPVGLCVVAQGLLVAPSDAFGAGLDAERMMERNTRPAAALLARAFELDAATPIQEPRSDARRVVGTCRHYAVLATAFLRAVGTPARARCGFAAYFVPPKFVDHWIVEYWSDADERWVRIDPEYVHRTTPGGARSEDLRPGEFLTAGEAWIDVRAGRADPDDFGVFGTANWGPGEIRGNAMRDLASVAHKIEMLPWDEWGPMTDSYNGTTGDDFDALIDDVAAALRDDDRDAMLRFDADLAVPVGLDE